MPWVPFLVLKKSWKWKAIVGQIWKFTLDPYHPDRAEKGHWKERGNTKPGRARRIEGRKVAKMGKQEILGKSDFQIVAIPKEFGFYALSNGEQQKGFKQEENCKQDGGPVLFWLQGPVL